ncbi:MAG: chemotaxis protein CheA [Peptococcaceae bacterium]|jgi:two-component system chemotaxis sensor kinase CheA|nr:chemotaxis protein CheA [Peptococcaceae bacterium]MDH7524059.1 chemotaxis protein CheA [Peptococcaceae bacterium]
MDMSQYQDLFIEEAQEHLQALNQNLLALENNPSRLDLLDAIFRAAHTLKGMSATMGYDPITQLTHEMENLLDKLREKKQELTTAVFNSLFKAADLLENMLGSLRQGESLQVDVQKLTAELLPGDDSKERQPAGERTVYLDDNGNGFNEYEINLIKKASEKGIRTWRLRIMVDPGCVMKGVRAFTVFRNLEEAGEIIKSIPHTQDIEDEKFKNEFVVFLVSEEDEAVIRKKVEILAEVQLGSIEEVKIATDNGQEKSTDGQKAAQDRAAEAEPGVQREKKQKVHQTVRVDINRLDSLMSLVGELVINKTRLEQINTTNKIPGLNETIEQISRITTDLQSVVQNVRMVAIEQVFNRFPRMVRDLAQELGKEVNLILEGKETELDRTVIDEIGDPLVHLIRNSLDHGLEPPGERVALRKKPEGLLRLSARQEGNQVIISVEDDGKGISIEKVKRKALENGFISQSHLDTVDDQAILSYIFEPGFSTAQTITDLSGRGVGLDVVKSKIQSLNGQVYIETKEGQGTKFIIKLPLTLAIIQALLVQVQDETYAIPLAHIDETTSLEPQQMKNVQEQQVMLLRGKVLPLFFLKDIFAVPGEQRSEDIYVVVVRKGEQQVGLVVDQLIGQQEIVINTLGRLLANLPGIAGASILGDGRVSLIIDIGTLF